MTSPTSADNQAKDQATSADTSDFAAQVQAFWAKNGSFILILCAAVLLAMIGREGWRYFNEMHERSVQDDYAQAVGSPERLARFAGEHSGEVLGAVALLEVADAKYSAGDYQAALAGYQKAADALVQPLLKARARLGAALSQFAAGDPAAAETALKALSADTSVDKTIRAEATYHLASLANAAGRAEDVRKLAAEISKIDATGIWAQRALALSALLPVESGTASLIKP